MAGTQAPKGFGLAFVLIGVPLIFWSASGTNQKVAALDTPESRQASCVAKVDGLGVKGTQATEMCGCIVERAGLPVSRNSTVPMTKRRSGRSSTPATRITLKDRDCFGNGR
jgi:hypothetical protein